MNASPPPRAPKTVLAGVAPALGLLLIAAVLSGCGSSARGTSADPATVVPGTAPLYIGAVVQPAGGLKADAISTARRLTHLSNPYDSLTAALLSSAAYQPDFNRDIKPWLGSHAGIFLTFLDASGPSQGLGSAQELFQGLVGGLSAFGASAFATNRAQGAIVLDTTDVARARSFLNIQAQRENAHGGSYRGVSYLVSTNGLAEGIVGRFAVLGSESGLRGVIDTELGGASIAHAGAYAKLSSAAEAGAVASLYTSPGGLAKAIRGSGGGLAQGLLTLSRLSAGAEQMRVSIVPSSNSIALNADFLPHVPTLIGPPRGSAGAGTSAAQALGALPEGSWLALGLGESKAGLPSELTALSSLVSLGSSVLAGSSVSGILEGLRTPLSALSSNGAGLQRALSSWMGSVGAFASGSGLLDLQAALVISSKDPARSRTAVATLAGQLRRAGALVAPTTIPGTDASVTVQTKGLPVPLDMAASRGRFVIGIGAASVQAAISPASLQANINPSGTLSASTSYRAAVAALGHQIQPSLMIDFPMLLGLLEGLGVNEDPTISKIVPYLKSLTTLAGGSERVGEVERFRIVLGLTPTS